MLAEDLVKPENYRDTVSTVNKSGKRNWVYAAAFKGAWLKRRTVISWFYVGLFLVLPWIKINDMPIVLINIMESKFIVFGKIFWPHDFFVLALGMVIFLVFILLFTIIYGRLFCGWICPQTVFMEFIFRPLERWIEGSHTQQKKLNEGEWNGAKLRKKALKHSIFILISMIFAHTFLSYIVGMDKVLLLLTTPISQNAGLFFAMMIFTGLFYAVFAYVREIVCTTVCPYGRLQGVLFDPQTLQIAYDYNRGEPRSKKPCKSSNENVGDCIDCFKCVQVCPTGIDIRNGLQMECVNCTACIDVCNEVMDKIKKPRGLIRYASENELKFGTKFMFTRKMKAYTVVLVLLIVLESFMIVTRKSVDVFISKTKGQTFSYSADGSLQNLYEAKIFNKTKKRMALKLQLNQYSGTIKWISAENVILEPESTNKLMFFVTIPVKEIKSRKNKISINVLTDNKITNTINTNFLGPFQ